MDGPTRELSLADWLERELTQLPAARDRHLVTGADGERYLFDTRSGLTVQLYGPAETLMEALFADGARSADLAEGAAARFPSEDLRVAMEECSQVLQFLRQHPTAPPVPEKSRPGFNLSLNAGMACNLACKYCDPLGYRDATRGQVMSRETAQQALDFFFEQVPEGQVGCVTYSVGGEPLLYRKLLDFVTGYTRALRNQGVKAAQYMISNGLLLTDGTVEYLRVNQIPFGMSLDGPPEAHDAFRVLPTGGGSYEGAREAAERVLEQFPHTSVSAVITAAFPRPLEVYRHLLELGFERIIVKPVRGRPEEPFSFTPENLPLLQEGYREYARYFVEELVAGRREIYAAINPYDYFARFVLRVFRREKHHYRCGAASMANLTVAPDGSFYPCEGFVGREEYKLGHVSAGFDQPQLERFSRLYVDDKPGCKDCWARYQCGGGCYLLGVVVNGDPAVPDPAECELTRFLVELAVWALNSVELRRPEALVELQRWCDERGWFGSETLVSKMARRQSRGELPVLNAGSSPCGPECCAATAP